MVLTPGSDLVFHVADVDAPVFEDGVVEIIERTMSGEIDGAVEGCGDIEQPFTAGPADPEIGGMAELRLGKTKGLRQCPDGRATKSAQRNVIRGEDVIDHSQHLCRKGRISIGLAQDVAMPFAPIDGVVDSTVVDGLAAMLPAERYGEPFDTVIGLDLDAIEEAARELDIVVMDEDVAQADLIEQAAPRKIHRLRNNDSAARRRVFGGPRLARPAHSAMAELTAGSSRTTAQPIPPRPT